MRHLRHLFTLILLSLAAVGCGEDSGDTTFEYRGVDLCTDPADRALVEMHVATDGGVGDGGVPVPPLDHPDIIVRDCALGPCQSELFSNSGLDACIATCLDTTTLADLSEGCAGCFVDATVCAKDSCVAECLASTGTECAECFEEHCQMGQTDCVGFELL